MAVDISSTAVEAAILARVIDPAAPTLSPEAARSIIDLDFQADDQSRMRALSAKASSGTLSAEERTELDGYNHVGHLLALLQSKARLSLKKAGLDS